MEGSLLKKRIEERLDALGLSARKASMRAGLHPDAIRNITRGKSNNPLTGTLTALARVLDVPLEFLTEAADKDGGIEAQRPPRGAVQLSAIPVRGFVQAGNWREAIEWDASSWYSLTVPADERYPGVDRFGLEVRGTSMDRLYPEGTILVCVRFMDLVRMPKPGERVICLRRSVTGEMEATVKEYQVDEKGRHVLWPRSHDPEHQQPIILGEGELPVMTEPHEMADWAHAGPFPDDGGAEDLIISALVIQSVRRE
jgi:transcriptional regulator with XRE-family HTH domain